MDALKQLYCPGCHEFHVNCRCSQIITTAAHTTPQQGDVAIIDWLDRFVEVAKKQRKAEPYWGHAAFCNFPVRSGNGSGRCNCGLSDILTVLDEYERSNGERSDR